MARVGQIYRQRLVDTVKEGLQNNSSVFLVSYTKLSSAQLGTLRKDLKKIGADVYVSRNRLAKLALREFNGADLADKLSAQTALIWSNEDPAAIAKLLVKFTEDRDTVSVQGAMLDGAVLGQGDVKRFSELPSKEVLLAQLLQVMLSPMTRFAGVLNGKSRELLSILKQLSEKKGGS